MMSHTAPVILSVPSCPSTSSLLRSMIEEADALGTPVPHGFVLSAFAQTAGRGQRGNSWEAEPGANLTFSILLRPDNLPALNQFSLSMAISLAIVDFLRELIPPQLGKVSIKWPNDIYVDNRKICGILIENSLKDSFIAHSIAGIGININQLCFCSDAPNPVSLLSLSPSATPYPLTPLLHRVTSKILDKIKEIPDNSPSLHSAYLSDLWRSDGRFHPFLVTATGTPISARILTVDPDGILHLIDNEGNAHHFAFKEVSSILS